MPDLKKTERLLWALLIGELVVAVVLCTYGRVSRAADIPETESTQVIEGIEEIEMIDVQRCDVPIAGIALEPCGISRGELAAAPEETEKMNQEDRDMLARLICAEVGGIRDDECLYACGSVVLNRMADECFPDTMHEVIYQTSPCIQYGVTKNGAIDKDPDERCLRIAEDLLKSGSTIPKDVVYQSEYVQGSGIWKVFENVIYCYK